MTSEPTQQGHQNPPGHGDPALRKLLNAAADAFFLHDEHGRILDANLQASESLGYTRDELLRMCMQQVEVKLSPEEAQALWATMQPGDSETLQGIHRRKDESTFPAETKLGLMAHTEGEKKFVALARDMTEHQRADKARDVFSSLGQKLSAISSIRDAGLVILNASDDLFRWDTAFVELYEASTGLLHNIAAFDIIDGERAEVRQQHKSSVPGSNTEKALKEGPQLILRRGSEMDSPNNLLIGDLKRPSASLMYAPIIKDERAIGLLSVQTYRSNAYDPQDLQLLESLADYCSGAFERTLAQERLREAEQRFTTAFDHAPIGLGLLKPDGDWIRVNRSLCEIVGYNEQDLLATGLHAITAYEDLSKSLDALLSVFAGDENFVTFETRLIHRSQHRVVVNFRASLVRDVSGQPLYLIAQIQDITRERRLERVQSAIRELGQKLVEATTQRQVAEMVLETADGLLGWDAAFVDVYNPETSAFYPVILIDTIDGKKREVAKVEYEVEAGTNAHRTLREGAMLIQRDNVTESSDHAFGSARLSASLMYVPVRREGTNVGVLSIQSYKTSNYSQDDLGTLQELADYCSTAFERAYAETKAAEAERALRVNEERFERVMRATTDVIYDWNVLTGEVWWNSNLEVVFGYPEGHGENRVEWWVNQIHPEDQGAVASFYAAAEAGKETWISEYRFLCSDGSYAVVFDRGHLVYRDGVVVQLIGSMMDITQRKRAEEELRHGAYHDPLTGLPNRTYMIQELDRGLSRNRRRDGLMLGLLFVDLDGFKDVNDRLGHAAGDQLLIEVARILTECVRPSDFVSRLAGDEFTVILYDLHTRSDADTAAARILKCLQEPIQLRAGMAEISASVGITLSTAQEISGAELLQQADSAMYRAKAEGKNRYEFFTTSPS